MILLAATVSLASSAAAGSKDLSDLLAAVGLERDLKAGYILRTDRWNGNLPPEGSKRIEYTLFQGNDYYFYAYSSTQGAKMTFHVQERDGTVVETRSWQKEQHALCFAGAEIQPKSTGTYQLVVQVERSPQERTDWSLVYAFK